MTAGFVLLGCAKRTLFQVQYSSSHSHESHAREKTRAKSERVSKSLRGSVEKERKLGKKKDLKRREEEK